MKKKISALLLAISMLSACGFSACKDKETQGSDVYDLADWSFTQTQLSGVDALGRKITPTTGVKQQKYVGVYFFPWFGGHDKTVYNIAEIMEQYENGIVGNPNNPLWALSGANYNPAVSPNGAFHYWNEPLFGYYHSADKWVIARQLEMLAWAQVDFIMLDYTNSFIYEETTHAILSVIKEMTEAGCVVPKMAFMLPNNEKSAATLEKVWSEYISKPEYSECFFVADPTMNPSGKPLVTADYTLVDNHEILSNIWAKQMFWAGSPKISDYFPAGDANIKQTNFSGMMGVNVGINTSWFSDCYLYPEDTTGYGRGWSREDPWGKGDNKENVLRGTLFEEQWKNVYEDQQGVDLVFISCWNEWWAQKGSLQSAYQTAQKAVFVDTFSEVFSKDIEPTKGDLGDNYYMQLVDKVREFKHTEEGTAVAHEKITVELGNISSWTNVKGNYMDIEGDARERNFQSINPSVIYKDKSNRTDIVRTKMTNDGEKLYIMVETKNDITDYKLGDDTWMNCYLSTGATTTWNGYDVLINRSPNGNGITTVERFNESEWTKVCDAEYVVSGNKIYYAIPLSGLGITNGKEIGVKIADGISVAQEVMNFYLQGDCAPMGRLNYAYLIA